MLEYTVFRAFRPLDNDETVVGVVVACYLTRVASLDRTFALARSLGGLVRSSGPVSNDARRTDRPSDRLAKAAPAWQLARARASVMQARKECTKYDVYLYLPSCNVGARMLGHFVHYSRVTLYI